MMCDVMPTISEDSISQRSSQFSGEDANFEQLMVSMLDERDKLMDSLRETQERLGDTEMKLAEVEKERDSLQRQIAANLPQVSVNDKCVLDLGSSIDSSSTSYAIFTHGSNPYEKSLAPFVLKNGKIVPVMISMDL